MTELVLVRHGETQWNIDGRLQGRADTVLTDRGRETAVELSRGLHDAALGAAYTSPATRAVDTAEAITAPYQLPAHRVPALHELDYGDYQGLTLDELAVRDPALAEAWKEEPWSVKFPGGESLLDVESRVLPALSDIAARHPNRRVLVVTHGHVLRVILTARDGIDRNDFWSLDVPNASVHRMTLDMANR